MLSRLFSYWMQNTALDRYWEENNYPSWNQDNLQDFLRKRGICLRTADGCWGMAVQNAAQKTICILCFKLPHIMRCLSPPRKNWCRIQLNSGSISKTLGIKSRFSAEKLVNIEELIQKSHHVPSTRVLLTCCYIICIIVSMLMFANL